MRSSTVIALALLASAGPALAAPIASPQPEPAPNHFAPFRRTPAPQASAVDESGALTLPSLSTVLNVGSVAAPFIGSIIDHFKHKGYPQQQQQARELEVLLRRAFDEGDLDDSGALNLKPIAKAAGTALSFLPLLSGLFHHDPSSGNSGNSTQQAREFEELLRRAVEDGDLDESGAFSFGPIFRALKPALKALPIIGSLLPSPGSSSPSNDGNSTQQAREFEELLRRAVEDGDFDESGAFSFGPLLKIFKPALKALPLIGSLLPSPGSSSDGGNSTQQARELLEFFARAEDDDESGAFIFPLRPLPPGVLQPHATPSHINLPPGVKPISFLSTMGGLSPDRMHARDLVELLARADLEETGALNLAPFLNAAKKALTFLPAVPIVASLLPSGSSNSANSTQQAREFEELLRRAVNDGDLDESGALSFKNILSGLSIGGSVLPIVTGLFHHDPPAPPPPAPANSTQVARALIELMHKREPEPESDFMDIFARALADDESGAFSIPSGLVNAVKGLTLEDGANIATIAGTAVSTIKDFFSGHKDAKQQRDLVELLARFNVDVDDDSGAFALPPGLLPIQGPGPERNTLSFLPRPFLRVGEPIVTASASPLPSAVGALPLAQRSLNDLD